MMFHVKHRLTRRLAVTASALLAAAVLATGCTGTLSPARGWAQPVQGPEGLLLVQSAAGRLTAAKPDGSRIADYQIQGPPTTVFFGLRESQAQPTPMYATPLVDRDAAYLVSYDGRVVRLKVDGSGVAEQWVVDLHEKVVATPVLRGDRLFVSTEHGRLEVLNAANGTRISSTRPTEGRVWGAPALHEGRIFISTLDSSEVVAVNADTGGVEWKRETVGAAAADLVVDGDLLVVPSFDRTIHALETAGGAERWRFTGDGWFVGRPLVTPQVIYAGTMRGSVYALDRQGKMLWRYQRPDLEFRAAPVLAGNILVVADRDGTFVGLDAATGAEKWTRTPERTKIYANGVLLDSGIYFVTDDHRLIRVDPQQGDIQSFNVKPPQGNGN